MYSATFGGNVGRLAQSLLRDPQRVGVGSHTDTHADIEQRLHWADDLQHKNALLDHLLTGRNVDQALVFTSTQRDADRLADRLHEMGHRVASLHGGMPQRQRNRVLTGMRTRDLRVLVATDVAARGLDVPTISHVINYGLPMKAEDYVHRIGHTGRAGRAGLAVTLAERRDAGMIHNIQRFTTQRIPAAVVEGLEPKRPEPQSQTKPFGQKPFGKAGFGAKPGFGKKAFGKKPHGAVAIATARRSGPGAQALRPSPERPTLRRRALASHRLYASLLAYKRNLQIRRPILFPVETASVDIAGAPEEHVAVQVDQVELHEVAAFARPKGANDLPKMLCVPQLPTWQSPGWRPGSAGRRSPGSVASTRRLHRPRSSPSAPRRRSGVVPARACDPG